MPALLIREDVSPAKLRQLAKVERDPRVARRLLAIAAALEGMGRETAAGIASMNRQTPRDWAIRYDKLGGSHTPSCCVVNDPPPFFRETTSPTSLSVSKGYSHVKEHSSWCARYRR